MLYTYSIKCLHFKKEYEVIWTVQGNDAAEIRFNLISRFKFQI